MGSLGKKEKAEVKSILISEENPVSSLSMTREYGLVIIGVGTVVMSDLVSNNVS